MEWKTGCPLTDGANGGSGGRGVNVDGAWGVNVDSVRGVSMRGAWGVNAGAEGANGATHGVSMGWMVWGVWGME